MHSRLEQFKNENSYIFEILDKIIIDFNFEHPSNKLDEISFNCDGNLIDVKLTQYEKIWFPIVVKFYNPSIDIYITCFNFIPDLICSPGRSKAIKKLFII